jgi:hypothetical protein
MIFRCEISNIEDQIRVGVCETHKAAGCMQSPKISGA